MSLINPRWAAAEMSEPMTEDTAFVAWLETVTPTPTKVGRGGAMVGFWWVGVFLLPIFLSCQVEEVVKYKISFLLLDVFQRSGLYTVCMAKFSELIAYSTLAHLMGFNDWRITREISGTGKDTNHLVHDLLRWKVMGNAWRSFGSRKGEGAGLLACWMMLDGINRQNETFELQRFDTSFEHAKVLIATCYL